MLLAFLVASPEDWQCPCDVSASNSGLQSEPRPRKQVGEGQCGSAVRSFELRAPSGRRLREQQVDDRRPTWCQPPLSEVLHSTDFSHKPRPQTSSWPLQANPLPTSSASCSPFLLNQPQHPSSPLPPTHPTPFSLCPSSSVLPVPEAAPFLRRMFLPIPLLPVDLAPPSLPLSPSVPRVPLASSSPSLDASYPSLHQGKEGCQ